MTRLAQPLRSQNLSLLWGSYSGRTCGWPSLAVVAVFRSEGVRAKVQATAFHNIPNTIFQNRKTNRVATVLFAQLLKQMLSTTLNKGENDVVETGSTWNLCEIKCEPMGNRQKQYNGISCWGFAGDFCQTLFPFSPPSHPFTQQISNSKLPTSLNEPKSLPNPNPKKGLERLGSRATIHRNT